MIFAVMQQLVQARFSARNGQGNPTTRTPTPG
jgi:hypothetical protein